MSKILALFALVAFVPLAQAQNYGTWGKYRDITINTAEGGGGGDVAGPVADFPLLVRLSDESVATGADVLTEALAGGADIRFTNATGTITLPHEVDHWSATSAAIWVQVPTIAGNATTTIRMYWNRPGTPDASDGNAVFPATNGFVGVWHMGGADGPRPSATASGPDAVPLTGASGATFSGRSRTGIIGLSDSLQGGQAGEGEYFNLGPMPGFGSGFTFSAWTYITSTASRSWMRIFDFGNGEAGENIFMGRMGTGSTLRFDVFPGQEVDMTGGIVTGEWRHLTATISGNTSRLYVNGTEAGSTEVSYEDEVRVDAFLGRSHWPADATFTGYFDEVRVSEVGRSADWIKLSYETQKPGVTAVSLGASQTQSVKAMYYGDQSPTYLVNAAIPPNSPVFSGSASGFSVTEGTLPAGLDLNGSTGVISGTPTTAAPQIEVVIGATVNGTPLLDTLHITISAGEPPGPPTNVTAVRGNGQATVSWSAPLFAGTLPVTSYVVRATADTTKSCTWTTGNLSCTVTGLTNGTPYAFRVHAVSGVGPGPASDSSASVTPATTPAAPSGVTAVQATGTPTAAAITVSWTAPSNTGGLPLTGTLVFGTPAGSCFAVAPETACNVTGLTYGTEYVFKAVASNAVGPGDTSATAATITPTGILPGAFVVQATGTAQPFTFVLSQEAIRSTEAFTMSINDIWGRTVWSRTVHPARDGVRELTWDSRNTSGQVVSSGMYVVRVNRVGGGAATNFVQKATQVR